MRILEISAVAILLIAILIYIAIFMRTICIDISFIYMNEVVRNSYRYIFTTIAMIIIATMIMAVIEVVEHIYMQR